MLVLQKNKLQAHTMKKALQKMGDVQHNTSNWNQDAGQLKSMCFFFFKQKSYFAFNLQDKICNVNHL